MKSEQLKPQPKQLPTSNDPEDQGGQADSSSSDSQAKDTQSRQKAASKKKPKEKPLICNVSDTKYPIVRYVCKKLMQFKLQKSPEGQGWDLMWTDNAVQPEQLSKMQPHQKINHFPGMYSLSRKNYLGRNLMRMRKKFPDEYNFFPLTWMLPSEWGEFKAYYQKDKKPKTFIVKPEASCQGRGIFLTRNIEEIDHNQHYVVQRYLTKPFLVDQLKFDFRIYVLLAGCSPLRIYLYNQGLTRFATEKYSQPHKDNLEEVCMHLTNYAINKTNQNFVYNESDEKMDTGHKRSLSAVLKMLKQRGHDVDTLWLQIKDIIIKTFCSAQPVLSHHYKSCQPDNYANNMCFQLLGLDIILDDSFKPYLLQVNYTPSFSTDTPLDKLIKKNAIKDSLVLMNLTHKAKNQVTNLSKDMLMKRMLTGKKQRLTMEEKQEEMRKAQVRRDQWEDGHLGGFEKIYPSKQGKYQDFLAYSNMCYEELTGANVRRNMKKQKSVQMNVTKKQSKNEQLQKIYKAKPPIPPFARTVQQRRSNLSTVKPMTAATQQVLVTVESKPKQQPSTKTNKTVGSETYYSTLPQRKLPSSQRHINPITTKIMEKRDSGNYLRPRLFEISSNFSKDI